jgi:hypothetical protein
MLEIWEEHLIVMVYQMWAEMYQAPIFFSPPDPSPVLKYGGDPNQNPKNLFFVILIIAKID